MENKGNKMEKLLRKKLIEKVGECNFLDWLVKHNGDYLVYYSEIGSYPYDTKVVTITIR